MKTSINLCNVTNDAAAAPIVAALAGQSWMNLIVEPCPYNGMLAINVGTNAPRVSKAALTEMVMGIMADCIRRAGMPVAA